MATNSITVGIVGGIGPESTVDYYKSIINGYRSLTDGVSYPRILINSINMTDMLLFIDREEYQKVVDLLLDAVVALKNAGASFAVIASNTPHVVFDNIQARSPIPLISIVEATCKWALTLELKKILLIGTRFTMQHHFYQDKFAQHGISVIVPTIDDQEIIHNIIFPELEEGIVIPAKKAQIISLCNNIIESTRCDGIILGCTELPLMLGERDFNIAVLNTTSIHINAAVEKMCQK